MIWGNIIRSFVRFYLTRQARPVHFLSAEISSVYCIKWRFSSGVYATQYTIVITILCMCVYEKKWLKLIVFRGVINVIRD